MLEIIKALLKDPAGLSADVKYHIENWLVQELYNQEDSEHRVSFEYKTELEKLAKQMQGLTMSYWTNRWIATKEETK
tara:strand:+ start:399 stop:629 length:231 start_codon:yes stop_codon:yes gene_type:complete